MDLYIILEYSHKFMRINMMFMVIILFTIFIYYIMKGINATYLMDVYKTQLEYLKEKHLFVDRNDFKILMNIVCQNKDNTTEGRYIINAKGGIYYVTIEVNNIYIKFITHEPMGKEISTNT